MTLNNNHREALLNQLKESREEKDLAELCIRKAKLLSYSTIVAEVDLATNEFKNLWEGSSNTTSSHIKAFKQFYSVS
jgi:hypothetical protein